MDGDWKESSRLTESLSLPLSCNRYKASLERIREENTQYSEGPRILFKRVCTKFK